MKITLNNLYTKMIEYDENLKKTPKPDRFNISYNDMLLWYYINKLYDVDWNNVKEINKKESNNLPEPYRDFKEMCFDWLIKEFKLSLTLNLVEERIIYKYKKGNKIKVTYPWGSVYKYEYDKKDNMIKMIDLNDNNEYVVKWIYNKDNSIIKEDVKNNGISTYKYEYNKNEYIIKEIHPYKHTWEYEYDEKDNLIKEIDVNDDIYEYKYDSNNNLIKKVLLTDKRLRFSSGFEREFDENNNKIKEIYMNDQIIWKFKYDENNKLININKHSIDIVYKDK